VTSTELGEWAGYAMCVGIDTASTRARPLAARLHAQPAAVPGWRVLADRPNAPALHYVRRTL
jgi:hypothetical protein